MVFLHFKIESLTNFIKTHPNAPCQIKEDAKTAFDEKSDNVAKQEKDV